MNFRKLGWRWPRPNDFSGSDQRAIRDSFMDLQKFLTFPYVRLFTSPNFNLGAGASTNVSWTVEDEDPYHLHQGTSTDIQVPQDFDSWYAMGTAGWAASGGAGQRRLTWRLNGVDTRHFLSYQGTSTVRAVLPLLLPVNRTDTIQFQVINQTAAAEDNNVQVNLIFFPLV